MTKAEMGELSCKLLGIYAFIVSLTMIQFPVSWLQPGLWEKTSGLAMAMAFIPTVLLLFCAAFLWLSSRRYNFNSRGSSEGSSSITPAILQDIAFSVAGIFTLIDAVPQLGTLVFELSSGPSRNLLFWLHLATFLVRLALGLWLLLGADGLRKFINRIGPAFRKDW
jgi:hypothetical protein